MKDFPPAVKRRIQFFLDEFFLGTVSLECHSNAIWILVPEMTAARFIPSFKSLLHEIVASGECWDLVLYDRRVFCVQRNDSSTISWFR